MCTLMHSCISFCVSVMLHKALTANIIVCPENCEGGIGGGYPVPALPGQGKNFVSYCLKQAPECVLFLWLHICVTYGKLFLLNYNNSHLLLFLVKKKIIQLASIDMPASEASEHFGNIIFFPKSKKIE